VSDLKLNLKGDKPMTEAVSPLGEFRISLDSQMINGGDRFTLPSPVRSLTTEWRGMPSLRPDSASLLTSTSFRGASPGWIASQAFVLRDQAPKEMVLLRNDRPEANGERIRHMARRDFGSTLTLTAGYLQEPRRAQPSEMRVIGAGTQRNRWSIYGEVGQEENSALPHVSSEYSLRETQTPVNINSFGRRAQRVLATPANVELLPVASDGDVPTLNNYYLEAMYKFRPELHGRISYQRSNVELQDPNENLQLEGIVETGKDFTIKAGYRNGSTPDTGERKPTRDKKVWTEFILKF
ncbi:MAG: hypothetical protein HQM09_12200, partial [Candidatus Riflebacteria bacterium]|nr:hypothetical protein [Candidatus Riflebacteria bacterium]